MFRSDTKKTNPCFLSEVIISWSQFISGARSLPELSAFVISSVVNLNTTKASCMKLSVFTSVLDFFLLQIKHNSCVFLFAEILILRLVYDMPSSPGFPETARDLLDVETTDTTLGLPEPTSAEKDCVLICRRSHPFKRNFTPQKNFFGQRRIKVCWVFGTFSLKLLLVAHVMMSCGGYVAFTATNFAQRVSIRILHQPL